MKIRNQHIKKSKISVIFCCLFFCFSAQSQQLEFLIDEALVNSPEIQKFELLHAIASEKVNEVNTMPNTTFGVGYFVSEPETRTGAQRFKVSAKQMIPQFGSITARENYISSLADAKYEDIVIAKRKLRATVSQSYYNLVTLKAKQKVLIENIKLLETYETLALTSVETGKASAVAVLRLQMRQNELEQLKKVLAQQQIAEQITLHKLLNRAKDTKIDVIDNLIIPSENNTVNTENLGLHPELIKYDKLVQSIAKSEVLNHKESNPMLGFGLDYIAVSERTDVNPIDNGKDIVMPMVSLSIPIFNKKYSSKTKQNKLKQQEITVQKQERLNRLETALAKAIYSRIASKITYEMQAKNLKQAKDAEEILIKSYETGTIDFNDVLDVQELQLKFQIKQIEAVQQYFIQTTIINYLSK